MIFWLAERPLSLERHLCNIIVCSDDSYCSTLPAIYRPSHQSSHRSRLTVSLHHFPFFHTKTPTVIEKSITVAFGSYQSDVLSRRPLVLVNDLVSAGSRVAAHFSLVSYRYCVFCHPPLCFLALSSLVYDHQFHS